MYSGDTLTINLAFKRLPPELATVFEAHYVARARCEQKAWALACSIPTYYGRLNAAKGFVRGYLGALADRAA